MEVVGKERRDGGVKFEEIAPVRPLPPVPIAY
jgi:hypothetical protein